MAFKPYPIVVGPILKEKVWGGKSLEKYTGMTGKNIGEAWMLADQSENRSVINNGAYRGMTISDLINRFPAGVLGKKLVDKYGKKFPLLFKYLDTNERISIQVHPDDAYAKKRGYPAGKTEMWYVLSNKFRSSLLVGFKSRQDKKSLERMVANGTLASNLKKYRPKKGDCFFIPAGTVHTIGKGNVIFEVQQNSDVTYRIYDWGRHNLAEDRHLNIQDAVASVDFNSPGGKIEARAKKYAPGFRVRPLAHCGYFLCDEVTVEKELKYWYNKNLPLVLTVAEGEVSIALSDGTETRYKKGGIVFIPYGLKDILFKIKDKTRIIVTQAR
jgi:mannose-6-phosphate isomerase